MTLRPDLVLSAESSPAEEWMQSSQSGCRIAESHVRQAISGGLRFPHNVFVGDWQTFLFFDSDWIVDSAFVEHVKNVLRRENGTCACLLNLEQERVGSASERLFINDLTTVGDYQQRLKGDGEDIGWAVEIGRLACASNTGAWCTYCERHSEIAVIAFRRDAPFEQYGSIVEAVHAVPFARAVEEQVSYGFSPRALSKEWRMQFLREYGVL